MAGEASGAPHFWVNPNTSSPSAHHRDPCTNSPVHFSWQWPPVVTRFVLLLETISP